MKFSDFKNSSIVLSLEQMAKIQGASGTCGYKDAEGYSYCGMSKAEAMFQAEGDPNYHWCCDSCASNGGSASYC